jgi:hypothetical protein
LRWQLARGIAPRALSDGILSPRTRRKGSRGAREESRPDGSKLQSGKGGKGRIIIVIIIIIIIIIKGGKCRIIIIIIIVVVVVVVVKGSNQKPNQGSNIQSCEDSEITRDHTRSHEESEAARIRSRSGSRSRDRNNSHRSRSSG